MNLVRIILECQQGSACWLPETLDNLDWIGQVMESSQDNLSFLKPD